MTLGSIVTSRLIAMSEIIVNPNLTTRSHSSNVCSGKFFYYLKLENQIQREEKVALDSASTKVDRFISKNFYAGSVITTRSRVDLWNGHDVVSNLLIPLLFEC